MKIDQTNYQTFDPYFAVNLIAKSPVKQMYLAMHQDYSEKYVCEDQYNKTDEEYEKILVNSLLKGDRGHYGPLEHSLLVFATGYFPHSVMQQSRTHRVGTSFDVQSFRYTGKTLYNVGKQCFENQFTNNELIEKTIYFRPVGDYIDRSGNKYQYTEEWRQEDLYRAELALIQYYKDIEKGKSYEHARGLAPFDLRQHFVVSFNIRSLMHFIDLRHKSDAQLEIQVLSSFFFEMIKTTYPLIAEWYEKSRLNKAKLAP